MGEEEKTEIVAVLATEDSLTSVEDLLRVKDPHQTLEKT